jgi:hypothetical protein
MIDLDELERELERSAQQLDDMTRATDMNPRLAGKAEGVRLALGKLRQARAAHALETAVRGPNGAKPDCPHCGGTGEGRGSDGWLMPCVCTAPNPASGRD